MSKKTGRSWVLGVEELKEYHETSRKMSILNTIGFLFFFLLGSVLFITGWNAGVLFLFISIIWIVTAFLWSIRAMVLSVIVEIRLKK